MSAIEISVPEDVKRSIEAQASSRGFDSAGEYIVALVEADRLRNLQAEVEGKLLDAVRSPSSPLTAQNFEDIRRRGQEVIQRRRQP
jgi:Arc/MetJ-type ribon-helix-helix transcriptional regulator